MTIKDKGRAVLDRWPCCYVISGVRYDKGVPDLTNVLFHDEVEAMRAVAAEALGGMSSTNAAARAALVQAAKTETSQWVLDTIARYLGKDMPARSSGS